MDELLLKARDVLSNYQWGDDGEGDEYNNEDVIEMIARIDERLRPFQRYVILGVNPVPWTSPNVAVIRTKQGKAVPKVYKHAELSNYQEAVKEEMAKMAPRAVQVEHERINLAFYLWRNAGTKNDHVADATNMQKALEDALQGILFANDRNVAHVETWIMEQGPDTEPRIVIEVGEAPDTPSLLLRSGDSFAAIQHHPPATQPEADPTFAVEEFF